MGTIRTVKMHAAERSRKRKEIRYSQALVPLTKSLGNGIFVSDGLYTKVWSFSNINYQLLNKEQELSVFSRWCDVLNIFEPGSTYKYTVMKKKVNEEDFKKDRLLPYKGDDLDRFRDEYNEMLQDKIRDTKLISEERFLMATTSKKNDEDARSFFARTEPELESVFGVIDSDLEVVDEKEFLKTIWEFYHMDSEDFYNQLDPEEMTGKKHELRDFLAPYQFKSDHDNNCLIIGGKYFRALYVPPNGYAKYIKDKILSSLMKLDKNMCISMDIMPINSDEANTMVENQALKVESNIAKFEERQNKRGNFNSQVPFSMRQDRKQVEEYNNDLNERDQRMILGHLTIVHVADTLQELNDDTDALKTAARKNGCELVELTMQHEDGLITALPFGVNRFIGKSGERLRTLTTESMASFIPFSVQDVSHKQGIYYGQNKVSKNPIFVDRKGRMNGNAVLLGGSGSGKSFKEKEELDAILLNTDDNVIIIDPEREYVHMVEELGGQVVNMSPDSNDHINAMEINKNYGGGSNPVVFKSESILSLYSMAAGNKDLDAKAKSIIDRCVTHVYEDFIKAGYKGECPTLVDLSDELRKQPEALATEIALTLELYTTGNLNLFAKATNVDMGNRLICFDISNLGENLMPIGMLIITDFIMNTLSQNRDAQKYTWVAIDELYLMFLQEYTAIFFYKLWKRIRKYGGLCTGITQELGDLLKSPTARTLLANSDFLIMLSANESDSELIADLLNISEAQMSHITNVGQGKGMIKLGRSFIPFVDSFPKHTELYKLMSTKMSEDNE